MKKRDHNKYFEFDDERSFSVKFCIHYFLAILRNVFYKLLLLGAPKRERKDTKYQVTICGIFKNEAPFMKEWICFHQLLGVEHFYLYNNFSEDDYQQVLEPFIKEGCVTLMEWPVQQGQMSAYMDWYEKYRTETKWNIFLDLDEYICPRYETNIYSWLKKYSKYPSVEVYWKMFGTAGQLDHDFNRLIIEQYHVSWERYDNIGKVFYNTYFDISRFSRDMMHHFPCHFKRFGLTVSLIPVNEFGFFRHRNINFVRDRFTIQVNHYWSKAYGAYLGKQQRGYAVFETSPFNYDYFLYHEQKNKSSDYMIYRFLIPLKLKLGINQKRDESIRLQNRQSSEDC